MTPARSRSASVRSTYDIYIYNIYNIYNIYIYNIYRYVVQITPAFKCQGVWPRSAAHWPSMATPWPHPNLAAQVKLEGFDLLSKESIALQNKQSSTSMEGDAWIISLQEAEASLLVGGARRRVLSMLKCIRDRHLDLQVDNISIISTISTISTLG